MRVRWNSASSFSNFLGFSFEKILWILGCVSIDLHFELVPVNGGVAV